MKKLIYFTLIFGISLFLTSCKKSKNLYNEIKMENPLYDVYYEIFVRSFADSNGDGIGDFNGITNNLDYLEELGVTALWLMPIHPSSSYHGYDVLDYYDVNPDYGTLDDFQNLINEAKNRNIKIMIDFVINHSSDQHEWFLAASDKNHEMHNKYYPYYYREDGSLFRSFVGSMVDFNLENQNVVDEIYNIAEFYIDMGVSGFRVDAAKHLIMDVDSGGNILGGQPIDNHHFLMRLNNHLKGIDENILLVSETFEYDYQDFGQYYRGSDSMFNFYISNSIIDKVKGLSRHDLSKGFNRTYEYFYNYRKNFIDAPFLTNHDQDRIASELDNYEDSEERLKLASRILLTLPGSPFIYYGEEIGMKGYRYEGENIPGYGKVYDEYRRQPLLWGDESKDTSWLPSDNSNKTTKSISEQIIDENSILSSYKEIIKIRKENMALMFGNYFEPYVVQGKVQAEIQAYIRHFEYKGNTQTLLIVHNLSNKDQSIELEHKRIVFGNTEMKKFDTLILEVEYDEYIGK